MSDSPFPHGFIHPPKLTGAEIGAWLAVAGGAAVYSIAFLVSVNLGYGDDPEMPAAWMVLGGWVTGVTIVPAIMLTGIRQLFPALWSVRTGESETGDSEQRGGDVEHVSADVDAEDAEQHE